MANHSLIRLKNPIEPEDVEKAVAEINQRRFQGRLKLEALPLEWANAVRSWVVYAPDSKPKEPGPFEPNEDLGFCFWLRSDGKGIETRHGIFNPWMRWIMYIHEHELARHFDVPRFDGGDGMIPTAPERLQVTFYDYAVFNFAKPLSAGDQAFVKRHFLDSVPEAWRSEEKDACPTK